MLNSQPANIQEQVARLEDKQQTALGILDAFEQLRELCPGYDVDISSGEHERVTRQYVQSSQQLAETKRKIALQPKQRPLISRVIAKVQSM